MQTRTFAGLAVAAAVAFGAATLHGDDKANEVIAAARKVLGGDKKLAALKALSLRVSYSREMARSSTQAGPGMNVMIQGSGGGPGGPPAQITGNIEIDVQFPDKYIKVDSSSGPFAMDRIEGFDGERPFADLTSSTPGVRVMGMKPSDSPDAAKAIFRRARADLARLLLGTIAGTQPDFPVTFTYAARAESPDGTADVLDVKGPDEFQARLFVDTKNRLPLMLTYMAPEARVVMRTATAGMPDAKRSDARPDQLKSAEPSKMIEYRVYFSDFRDVDGLLLPHHFIRGTATATTEEWDVTSYRVNPQLKADRFKVS